MGSCSCISPAEFNVSLGNGLRGGARNDDVDPGGWEIISPAKLLVPVDTHMHNISLKLGFTRRKTADLKAAIEITQTFAKICPEDPTKYDFVLTRFGIRDGLEAEDLAELFDKENFS